MKKVAIISLIALCACNNTNNHSSKADSEKKDSAVVETTDSAASKPVSPTADPTTGFEPDTYEQGLFDGVLKGTDDAIHSRKKSYKFAGKGEDYERGYREAYDKAYEESKVDITPEAQQQLDSLLDQYLPQ